ncbi:MAG: hypothetical protein WBE37_19705 [Bryobacteraceae bacterium]
MKTFLFLGMALGAALAFAQNEPPAAPSFEAKRVLFVDHPVPLAPGLVLSIFGNDLGPGTGCHTDHDEKGTYPKELCDTRVLVGGIPSELLWVQAGQINFKVPQETPIQGTADLAVVYQGRSSKPVTMPLGIENPTLSLESPARVGMPIWLKLNMPYYRDPGIRIHSGSGRRRLAAITWKCGAMALCCRGSPIWISRSLVE